MPDYPSANDWKARGGRNRRSVTSPDARACAAGREDRRCNHCLRIQPHFPRPDGTPSVRCAACNEYKRHRGVFPPHPTSRPLEEGTWVRVEVDGAARLGYLVRREKRSWVVGIMDGPEVRRRARNIEFAAYPEQPPPRE